jgi:hypothetical protein
MKTEAYFIKHCDLLECDLGTWQKKLNSNVYNYNVKLK